MSDGMDFWRWREANPNGTHCEAYQAGYEAAREWLPIETAPKDGTRVLLRSKWGVEIAHYDNECVWLGPGGHWVTFYNRSDTEEAEHPTHWQPLPSPPKEPT